VPAIQEGAFSNDDDAGPVLVTVEYDVAAERVSEFVEAMHRFGRIRRRDGASRWGIFRDLETPGRFVETFIVASWAEHLRQHDRERKLTACWKSGCSAIPGIKSTFIT
jgi:Transmembrane secretion effector